MPDEPHDALSQPVADLGHAPIPRRKGTAKESETLDGCAVTAKLLRQLESDAAAGAVAGDDARACLEGAYLGSEVRGEFLDGCQWLAAPVEAGRLQTEERLIVAEFTGERAITKNVSIVSGSAEDRRPCAAGLQGDDGALLLVKLVGRAKKA